MVGVTIPQAITLTRPRNVNSAKVVKDNSAGSTDLVEPLFTSSTPCKSAVIYRDKNDAGTIYVGGADKQEFPLDPGASIVTEVGDLSKVYVRVPAGVTATLYVLWEVA